MEDNWPAVAEARVFFQDVQTRSQALPSTPAGNIFIYREHEYHRFSNHSWRATSKRVRALCSEIQSGRVAALVDLSEQQSRRNRHRGLPGRPCHAIAVRTSVTEPYTSPEEADQTGLRPRERIKGAIADPIGPCSVRPVRGTLSWQG